MSRLSTKLTCVVTLTFLVLATVVFAQERDSSWGTPKAPCMAGKKVTPVPSNLGAIEPAMGLLPGSISPSALVFPNSQYAAGGAGLRNRTRAHIQITGGNANLQLATAGVMYWAIITTGPAPAQYYTVKLINEQAGLKKKLTGTVIGTGPSPCWPGDTITVFRVLVPSSPGGPLGQLSQGDYEVDVSSGAANVYNDPWVGTPSAPEWEGVSLILVFPGDQNANGTVAFYDTGIAGMTFGGTHLFGDTLGYTLVLPPSASGPFRFTTIGADGQVGNSVSAAFPQIAAEQTFIDNTQIAGFTRTPHRAPDTLDPDSDWNGTIAGPLPQLWDTTSHTISPGPEGSMDVTYTNAKDDCLTPVANVVFLLP